MSRAIVTPNKPWPVATHAKVEYNNKIYENVPIFFVINTPVIVSIHRNEYPIGVVILNEIKPPNNSDPIELPVITNDATVEIQVLPDGSWPWGYVILWDISLNNETS